MFDRLVTSVVALSLAFLAWLYVRSRDQEMLDGIPIPVQVSLAANQADQYELEITVPSQVAVSFTGPPSRIREVRGMLQRGELHVETTITAPAEAQEESRILDAVRIDASDIHAPPGVTVIVAEGRNRIPVTLLRLVERRLPVRFENAGDVRIAQAMLEPATVTVRGPQEILDKIRAVPTQPYTLPTRVEPIVNAEVITARSIPLVQELEGRRVQVTPASVSARLTLQPQQKIYELAEVPVHFLCPANFPLRPMFRDERAAKITLRVQGPAGEESPAVVAYVDLASRKWEAGLYEEPLKLQLPREYQLIQNATRAVAFQLTAGDVVLKPAPLPLPGMN
jgi:hypothetical protein